MYPLTTPPSQPQGWNTISTKTLKNFSLKEFHFLLHEKYFRWDLKVYEKWLQMEKVFLEGNFPSFFSEMGDDGRRCGSECGSWMDRWEEIFVGELLPLRFSLLYFFVVMKFSFLLHIYNVGVGKEWEWMGGWDVWEIYARQKLCF